MAQHRHKDVHFHLTIVLDLFGNAYLRQLLHRLSDVVYVEVVIDFSI